MVSKKYLIKQKLCHLPFFNKYITNRSININKRNIQIVEETLNKKGLKMNGPLDYKYINTSDYTHCNIWGSGYSASRSAENKKFTTGSFDIGFSFSYLMELDFDLYFLENASEKISELVSIQKKGLREFLDLKKCKIIFKNILEEKNDLNYAIDEYSNLVSFARDIMVPHYINSNSVYKNTTQILLQKDPFYFRQSCSSVITSIIFARFLGFKDIVLHGVDFGGKYFFDLPEYDKFSGFKPPQNDLNVKGVNKDIRIYDKKYRYGNSKHPTCDCLKRFLPLLKENLKKENIHLYSASEKSPLSKILPIYEMI